MKKIIVIMSVVIAVLLFVILALLRSRNTPLLRNDADEWHGEQTITGVQKNSGEIAIPGYTALVFQAEQTEQKVNIYNPDINDCLFRFTLIIDGAGYWQSGYCAPNHGYYTITLNEPLPAGEYNGLLRIECFRENGEQLNGASQPITIISEE